MINITVNTSEHLFKSQYESRRIKILNEILNYKEKLEFLEVEYIKLYGKDSLDSILTIEKNKLNQIKILDTFGKSIPVKLNKTYHYINIYIHERPYKIVKYNKQRFITIEDSIKDCLLQDYILGMFKQFQCNKDYIRVKIEENTKKTIVLTRRGLLKYLVYLNDNIIKDEKIRTKVNDLIDLSEYLTYSCEV